MCLSRESCTRNDQILDGNATNNIVTDIEQEEQGLIESAPPSCQNRGTSSIIIV